MKKTLLSSLLSETSKMEKGELDSFYERAESNPFDSRKRTSHKFVRNVDDLGDYVRTVGDLDNRVRDLSDLEHDDYNAVDWEIEQMPNDDDDNLTYIAPHRMRHYKRNEYNQDSDIEDIDMYPGEKFMMALAAKDEVEGDFEGDFEGDELMDGYPFDSDYDDEVDDEDELSKDEFDNLLNSDDEDPTDEFSDDDEDPESDDEFSDLDPEEDDGDSKFQGIIRSVKGAYLVSKRQQPDETYTEVWMYNVGEKYDDDANIRSAILSGTDIDPTKGYSEDNSQEAHMTTLGNVQYLTVSGVPS